MGPKLLKFVVLFGAAQAFAWSIMSLLAVANYHQGTIPADDASNFVASMYIRFLNPIVQEYYFPNVVVTSSVWVGFMWIYFILNLCWCVTAFGAYWDLRRVRYRMHKTLLSFSIDSLFIVIIDFIFVIMLAADHGKTCTGDISLLINIICKDGIVPFMVIVGKFAALWIWNLIVGIAMYKISVTVKSKVKKLSSAELQKQTQMGQLQSYKVPEDAILHQNVITVQLWRWEIRVNEV